MAKLIIFLVLIAVLVIGVFFILVNNEIQKGGSGSVISDEISDNTNVNDVRSNNFDNDNVGANNIDSNNDNFRDTGSGENPLSWQNQSKKNESESKDLDEGECGYYFESQGFCGGFCPDGTCVSEGRSCYCKKS